MANPTRHDFWPAGSCLVVAARDVPLMSEPTLAPVIVLQERGIPVFLATHASRIVPNQPQRLNIR